MRTVSLMTARRQFSRLIRDVERGESFLIARLVPHGADKAADPAWAAACARMMARLEEGAPLGGLRIVRDGLQDR